MGRRKKVDEKVNHIYVVQDRSGSMYERFDATISGFNEFLGNLKRDAEGKTLITLVQFNTEVTMPHAATPLGEMPELTPETYVVGGMTALRDAVGIAVQHAEGVVKDGDNVAFTIMTDGKENSSTEFSPEGIKTLLERKTDQGWEFNYLGAGPAAWGGSQLLGIPQTHTINYGTDAHDHQEVFAAAAVANVAKTRGLTSSYAVNAAEIKTRLETNAHAENVDWQATADGSGLRAVRRRRVKP